MSLWSILQLTLNSDLKVNTICTYIFFSKFRSTIVLPLLDDVLLKIQDISSLR